MNRKYEHHRPAVPPPLGRRSGRKRGVESLSYLSDVFKAMTSVPPPFLAPTRPPPPSTGDSSGPLPPGAASAPIPRGVPTTATTCTVALLSPDGNGTGNRSTSRRIARHLETAGYRVVPINACAGGDDGPRSAVLEAGAAAAIGVHGFRSGRHLIAIGVPYAIVFGGTDLSDPKYHRGDAGRIIGAAV